MALTVIFSFLINLVLIHGRTEVGVEPGFRPDNHTHFDVYASALSRAHYNPWVCDYRSEPGYKCLSCSSALHCFPGNFALLIQCANMFPYCRNGYCSRFKTEGCIEESDPSIVHSTMPPLAEMINKVNKTILTVISPNNVTKEPILNDSVPQGSASNPVVAQTNDPNKINESMVKPNNATQTTNVPYINKKPKDSPQSLQISKK